MTDDFDEDVLALKERWQEWHEDMAAAEKAMREVEPQLDAILSGPEEGMAEAYKRVAKAPMQQLKAVLFDYEMLRERQAKLKAKRPRVPTTEQ
jgi:hypothetical protein